MKGARSWGRLTRPVEFQAVRRRGTRLRGAWADIYTLRRSDSEGPRLGLAVSRRVGGAVRRNRWKRLVREYVRLRAAHLGPLDLVVVPRPLPPPSFRELAEDFDALWSRHQSD